MPRKEYTVLGKLCEALELPRNFRPLTRLSQLFQGIEVKEIIACLRNSTDESAQVICAYFDRLNKSFQSIVSLDYLVAAAKCKDPHSVAGMIGENYSRFKSLESSVIASREAPGIMRDVASKAKTKKGFKHAHLALQIATVAAVPRNQQTTNYIVGNKIDKSKHLALIGVPTHHEVIGEVNDILRRLPQGPVITENAPSPSDSAEDSGFRERQED